MSSHPLAGLNSGSRSARTSSTAAAFEVDPDPVPAQFFFRDSEGNRVLIVQPG